MERKEELKKSIVHREGDLNHFQSDTHVSEFLSDLDGNNVELQAVSSSHDEDRPMAQKLEPVRSPGPTIRSHNEVEKKEKPDWLPGADEKCFPGDYGISDEEDETEGAYKLPSVRKRRNMKLKERVWFDAELVRNSLPSTDRF
ncbi:Protein FAR1-RELATED SEQUENCE 5 [Hordeum vulgare]|nr:Protein FAR1-RELATED SEQUENCE 5 [Hordeum vulgare]